MSDEFEDFDPASLSIERPSLSDVKAVLTTASSLAPEEDLGDFEPGGLYKGFTIVPYGQLPAGLPATHSRWVQRFYVASPLGAIGLVPWAGSKIIWPWEAAWVQDMYRPQVESLLKEPKEKKR